MKQQSDDRMYSGTPCDLCGGPTLVLSRGSIWCPSEDAHFGGHFVTQVAFERSPLKGGMTRGQATDRTGPRVRKVADIRAKVERERKPVASPFGGGMDDFIGEDAK